MKKGRTAKKAKKLAISIVVSSIIGLILLSLLPWISVVENDSVKEDLYFNFEMMKKSSNEEISDLADDLNLINISFWALIILCLLSYIGATIQISGKFSVLGNILLLIGCTALIFSILVIYLQLIISENIGKIDTISASTIYTPINYAYILLIPSFLILICSAIYTGITILHSIQKFTSSKKSMKDKKEEKKTNKKKSETKAKEPAKKDKLALEKKPLEPVTDEKRIQMEQWLTDQAHDMETQAAEEASLEPVVKVKSKQPFPEEKPLDIEEKSKQPDELLASKSLEDALSSAIQKKQTEIEGQELLETENNKIEKKVEEPKSEIQSNKTSEENEEISPQIEESVKNKISIRCPQCKHTFIAEKGEGITKIKCPECGKEGVIK